MSGPALRAPPAFRPAFPWWGGDLQTIRNAILAPLLPGPPRPETRLLLPLPDGDALVACRHEGERAKPMAVLVHGLTGDSESTYVRATARHLLSLGYGVLRLNLRGAGASARHCRGQYHAGRSDDLRDALSALPDPPREGYAIIGFSLGGNMVCRFLAEHAAGLPVRAAAIVSAPIELKAACLCILRPRNRPYHRWLISRMKREALANPHLPPALAEAVREAATVYEFDDHVVAPLNGFADAEDYYERCSGARFLGAVRVPTLVIHAEDDPWIPAGAYRAFDWAANPALTRLSSPGGGHVGFHQAGDRVAWHDRWIAAFLAERVM